MVDVVDKLPSDTKQRTNHTQRQNAEACRAPQLNQCNRCCWKLTSTFAHNIIYHAGPALLSYRASTYMCVRRSSLIKSTSSSSQQQQQPRRAHIISRQFFSSISRAPAPAVSLMYATSLVRTNVRPDDVETQA